jgi:hypothetical protein
MQAAVRPAHRMLGKPVREGAYFVYHLQLTG